MEAERRWLLSAEGGSCEGVTRGTGAIRGEEEEEAEAEAEAEEVGDVGAEEMGGCDLSAVAIGVCSEGWSFLGVC